MTDLINKGHATDRDAVSPLAVVNACIRQKRGDKMLVLFSISVFVLSAFFLPWTLSN